MLCYKFKFKTNAKLLFFSMFKQVFAMQRTCLYTMCLSYCIRSLSGVIEPLSFTMGVPK